MGTKWKTAISQHKNGELYIRGHALTDLMECMTFPEAVFLMFGERLPTPQELELFNMMLVSAIEHGVEAPSAFSARVSASVGNPLHVAAAAGLLSVGQWHGGAIEQAAKYFESKESPADIVAEVLAAKKRFPGFGHVIYKDKDPRAEALLTKAKELGIAGEYTARAKKCESELEKQSGKHLPINIDGTLAALLLELKFDSGLGNAFFVLARLPGIIAHAHEEQKNEKPYRRLESSDIEYQGPAPN